MEKVEIKHYTVAQVRNWLDHNIESEGLTCEVIRPAFAWALIHNPDVKENDPIVAAIYDDNKLAAATCAFPEIMVKPDFLDERGKQKRVWWFPMLWVKPEYRGKGYGLVVIGSLAEVYGMDCAWTAWAVPESIEVFEFIGCSTYYFPRYFMSEKNIKTSSLKGKLAYAKQECIKWWKNSKKPRMPHYDYELRYLREFDDYTCDFTFGERNYGGVIPLYILTNCDYVSIQVDGREEIALHETDPEFTHLPGKVFVVKEMDGSWGNEWRGVTFRGYKDGKLAIAKPMSADQVRSDLKVEISNRLLPLNDALRIHVSLVDQLGNILHFADDNLKIEADNCELLGPSEYHLYGGEYAFYVRSVKAGRASVTIRCGGYRKSVSFRVGKEGVQ